MYRLLFLLAILLTTVSPAFGKKAPGYYINLEGDTLEVQFSITHLGKRFKPSIDLAQNGRALYFDEEDRLQYLSPAEVLEIGATYKGHSIRKLSRQHPNISLFNSLTQYNHGYIFFDLHVDGFVKLISYIEYHPGGAHKQVMLQYDDHLLTQIEWNLFGSFIPGPCTVGRKDPAGSLHERSSGADCAGIQSLSCYPTEIGISGSSSRWFLVLVA